MPKFEPSLLHQALGVLGFIAFLGFAGLSGLEWFNPPSSVIYALAGMVIVFVGAGAVLVRLAELWGDNT